MDVDLFLQPLVMTSDHISGDTHTSMKTTVEHKINELIAWLYLKTSGKHFSCIWDDTKITSNHDPIKEFSWIQ